MRIYKLKEQTVYVLELDAHRGNIYEKMHLQIDVSASAELLA